MYQCRPIKFEVSDFIRYEDINGDATEENGVVWGG